MSDFIRQSSKQLRLWLLAAAAILLLTSVIEAGHIHGTFTETDDHCTLCQHSVALDKILATASDFSIPLLVAVFGPALLAYFEAKNTRHFVHIRAPPVNLHHR